MTDWSALGKLVNIADFLKAGKEYDEASTELGGAWTEYCADPHNPQKLTNLTIAAGKTATALGDVLRAGLEIVDELDKTPEGRLLAKVTGIADAVSKMGDMYADGQQIVTDLQNGTVNLSRMTAFAGDTILLGLDLGVIFLKLDPVTGVIVTGLSIGVDYLSQYARSQNWTTPAAGALYSNTDIYGDAYGKVAVGSYSSDGGSGVTVTVTSLPPVKLSNGSGQIITGGWDPTVPSVVDGDFSVVVYAYPPLGSTAKDTLKTYVVVGSFEPYSTSASPTHTTVGSQYSSVYSFKNNTVHITVTASTIDGSMTVKIGNNALTTSATNSRVMYDPTGNGAILVVADGSSTATKIALNADGTQGTSTQVSLTSVNMAATTRVNNQATFSVNWKVAAPQIGSAIGSALGNFLANGNKVEGILYSSVLGVIGQNIASSIMSGHSVVEGVLGTATQAGFQAIGTSILSAGAGVISSTLAFQLAQDLGITGFGAELFSTVVSSTSGAVVSQVVTNLIAGAKPFSHFVTSGIGKGVTNLGSVAVNAVASFLGQKLGSLVIQVQTQAAAILSSLGSEIGSIIGSATPLGPLGAFIGSFIGDVIGTFIGNLFGHKLAKPVTPTAGAETILNLPYAQYKLGTVTSTGGASTDIAIEMAQVAAQTLNSVISEVTGAGLTPHFVSNTTSPTVTYGYVGSSIYYRVAGGSNQTVAGADIAVDKGVMWALPQTQIIGGNIFLKRAIKNSLATDVTTLMADLESAKDYSKYTGDRTTVDGYIAAAYTTLTTASQGAGLTAAEQSFYTGTNKILVDKVDISGATSLTGVDLTNYNNNKQAIDDIVAALKSQTVANPWIVTLERASELGLANWNVSDFYGGISGFLQSFGLGFTGSPTHYEDIRLSLSGNDLTVTDTSTKGVGLFSALVQSNTDGSAVTISSFTTAMGYANLAAGTLTSGNTIESAAGTTTNFSLNDTGHAGYNIFMGGNGVNTITAGTNDSWVVGGAGTGTDVLTGGAGHDVIIAGAAATTIYGGNAGSYLVGGTGADSIFGGTGDDTIVLGRAGTAVSAGNGNDLIILTGYAGGSGALNGGAGSNTISFERYASGVTVNLGAYVNPTGASYTLSNIGNVIGSVAGNNVLQTGSSGGLLQGGAGNDTFTGGGGITTVSFSNSGEGVYVDLATGVSYGGSSTRDKFTNIQAIVGSSFDDVFVGAAGSSFNGGTGGDDWFYFSGGGNTFIGSSTGNNTLMYGDQTTALTVNFTTGIAQVAGYTQDTISNIVRVVGSHGGSTITGRPSYTTTTVNGVTTETGLNGGIYFAPTGGTNTLAAGSYDTVELGTGAGQTTVSGGNHQTLAFAGQVTYDSLWIGYKSITRNRADPLNFKHYLTYSQSLTFYIGTVSTTADQVTYSNTTNKLFNSLSEINMDGASILELSGITQIVGPATETITGDQDPGDVEVTTDTGGVSAPLGSVVTGVAAGGALILVGGGATTINVDAGAATTNGSVVIAGVAAAAGLTINTSAGDDQITYESGDGHYTINGTGGQKTIDFGPSVGINDIQYSIVGNDLYIGLVDSNYPTRTADQEVNSIRIVGGAVGSIVSGAFKLNNAYYVEADGKTIDLSRIDINYKLSVTTSTTFSANSTLITVGNSLVETISGANNTLTTGTSDTINLTGSGNVVNSGSASTINLNGAGDANTINMTGGTIKLNMAGSIATVTGNNDTITVTGSGSAVTIHGTGEIINASNTTIYKGNTSTATINGTGNTVVVLGTAPVVLDLGGDGLELTSVASSDIVTTASNGALTRMGWVGPDNGILVTDRNHDGQFGDIADISFVGDKSGATTDLEGLSGWDSNGDGVVSALDSGWGDLNIWVDANMDGVSSPGEVRSLGALGITSIGLQRVAAYVDASETSDSYASGTSSFTRADGSSGVAYDVTLGQQVFGQGAWNGILDTNAGPLTGQGRLGHLTGLNGTSDVPQVSYTAALTSLAGLTAPAIDETGTAPGQSGAITTPNRGAHIKTQRLQVLAIDLADNGPDIVDLADSTVKVDVNLTGHPYSVAWVGKANGMLVIDAAGDGNIDAATEATFQNWIPYATTSLYGLSAFDTNADKVIDAGDKVFDAMRIWSDVNGDGVSQATELRTLTDVGIRSIGLGAVSEIHDSKDLTQTDILADATVTMTDGTTRALYDIALAVKPDDQTAPAPASAATYTPGAPLTELAKVVDTSGQVKATASHATRLSSPLDSTAAPAGSSPLSDGPERSTIMADAGSADVDGQWWDGRGLSLSDAINAFSSETPAPKTPSQTPATSLNDAAMIQRHLLLRQAIAGFTTQGSAPAVFARQGSLDGLSTLAAATQVGGSSRSGAATRSAAA